MAQTHSRFYFVPAFNPTKAKAEKETKRKKERKKAPSSWTFKGGRERTTKLEGRLKTKQYVPKRRALNTLK
jgi:hypothetical protein